MRRKTLQIIFTLQRFMRQFQQFFTHEIIKNLSSNSSLSNFNNSLWKIMKQLDKNSWIYYITIQKLIARKIF